MEDLNKELEQITEEINAIDKRLDKILQEQINENEEINWSYMETYVSALKSKELTTSNQNIEQSLHF